MAQVATTLLLLLLGGPLRASTYMLLHGVCALPSPCGRASLTPALPGSLGLAVGLAWQQRLPWLISVPLASLVCCAYCGACKARPAC